MDFITDKKRFSDEKHKVDKIVYPERKLPEQVFRKAFGSFRMIDFDEIYSRAFFERMHRFIQSIGEDRYTLMVLDPDPETYFYNHFGKYPVLDIQISDSSQDYVHALHMDPGGSPADALAINSFVVLIYSNTLSWAIYGDRNIEIGVVAMIDTSHERKFAEAYPPDRLFSVEEALELVALAYYGHGIPDDVRTHLLENYGKAKV